MTSVELLVTAMVFIAASWNRMMSSMMVSCWSVSVAPLLIFIAQAGFSKGMLFL